MVLYDDTSPTSKCEGWTYLTLGATWRTRTGPFPHSWRHNNTHDPICRWTLTFNELFNVDTQANGDGSLSLFCSYDLFLCKYYEILLLLLEIILVLGSGLIMLVPYLSQSRLLSCHQRPCGNQSCLCVLLFLLSPQSYPCVCLVTLSPGPCVYLFIISLCSVLLCPQ